MLPGSMVTSDTRIYDDDIAIAIAVDHGITWFISTVLCNGSMITFHVTDDVIARSHAFGSANIVIPPAGC
jgi:hypothetical protein